MKADAITTYYQDSYPKYVRSEGKFTGICIEILRAIEAKIGTRIVNKGGADNAFRPLKRIQVDIKNGDIDVFLGMAINDRRAQLFDYISTPLYSVNHVVAVRSGEYSTVRTLDDIRQLGAATILKNFGTATERYLRQQTGLNIDTTADTLELNLRKLLLGRGDFVYFHDIGLYSTIRQKFPNEPIDVLPSRFRSYDHYLVVSKAAPKGLKQTLEKAVADLQKDGTLAKIAQKYKTKASAPDGS